MREFIDKALHLYVGRFVAFVLLPVITSVSITVVPWVNDVLGTDLTQQQVANAVIAVVAGEILAGWQWLKNRGNWEVADRVHSSLEEAYDVGVTHVEPQEEPVPVGPVR